LVGVLIMMIVAAVGTFNYSSQLSSWLSVGAMVILFWLMFSYGKWDDKDIPAGANQSKTPQGLNEADPGAVIVVIVLCLIGAAVVWIGYTFFYAQSAVDSTVASDDLEGRAKEVDLAVRGTLAEAFGVPNPRLQRMKGDNLDIYISVATWQTVPFPDRKEITRKVGKAWCDRVRHTFLPEVRIRDVGDGKTLAAYSCIFDWAR
jgi:hypothetical protein